MSEDVLYPGQVLCVHGDRRQPHAELQSDWGVCLGDGKALACSAVGWLTVDLDTIDWTLAGGYAECVESQGRPGFVTPHGYLLLASQRGRLQDLSFHNWRPFKDLNSADREFYLTDNPMRPVVPGETIPVAPPLEPGSRGHQWEEGEHARTCPRCGAEQPYRSPAHPSWPGATASRS